LKCVWKMIMVVFPDEAEGCFRACPQNGTVLKLGEDLQNDTVLNNKILVSMSKTVPF
jgi:hypothetical protein